MTATASGRGDQQAIMWLATSAERTALLLELGTRTTGIGRVIHLDRDNGLWAEPYQSPIWVRVTAAMVRDIPLAAWLTEHQPGTEGFPHLRAARRQDQGRARADRRPATCGAGRRTFPPGKAPRPVPASPRPLLRSPGSRRTRLRARPRIAAPSPHLIGTTLVSAANSHLPGTAEATSHARAPGTPSADKALSSRVRCQIRHCQ
jgi:hypothetical protein